MFFLLSNRANVQKPAASETAATQESVTTDENKDEQSVSAEPRTAESATEEEVQQILEEEGLDADDPQVETEIVLEEGEASGGL